MQRRHGDPEQPAEQAQVEERGSPPPDGGPPAEQVRVGERDSPPPDGGLPPPSQDIQDWGDVAVVQADNVQLPDGTWSHGGWTMTTPPALRAVQAGERAAEQQR
jgi:hypothetical protein